MTITLTDVLALAGATVLIAALVVVRSLVRELSRGQVRRQWHFLGAQVLSVIGGYIAYTVVREPARGEGADLVATAIFFFAACLVLAVTVMSRQTVRHVQRIAVLERENITDTLMGIHNRRYAESRLKEEVARARRHNLPLSALLLDADNFKRINDACGHHVGDLALSAWGRLILNTVRTPDIVARYGGEELLVIAPDTALSSAAVLAERLRRMVEDTVLVPSGEDTHGQPVRITTSIGVAALGPEMEGITALVGKADKALFQAKRAGRNQVVVAGDPGAR